MRKRLIIGMMAILALGVTSCYPELSVQQYDQLRADLEAMDVQRQEMLKEIFTLKDQVSILQNENITLNEQLAGLNEQLAVKQEKDAKVLAYTSFLNKLVSTQSSELILKGQFDITALVDAKETLLEAAEVLGNGDVAYYLGLISADDEVRTVGAYYKVIESCVKRIKANLE